MRYSLHVAPIIELHDVSKRYVLHGRGHFKSLKEELHHLVAPSSKKRVREEFWALKNISFTVESGEVVGILGRNGAGKTTLLKVIAGITKPTKGSVRVHGRIGTLFGLGLGMHPELTGRENILASGILYDLSRRTVRECLESIVDFAELGKFIDVPLKFYSHGMHARLSFTIATHLERPDILLIDEALAAGDIGFRAKALAKMGQLIKGGDIQAVLLVTQGMQLARTLCTKCVYLQQGQIARDGGVEDVVAQYVKDAIDPLPREDKAHTVAVS
jgi:lipopolysaccharide transport system ATP-binding protein